MPLPVPSPLSPRGPRAAWVALLAVMLVASGLMLRGTERDLQLLLAFNGMALPFAHLVSALSVLGLGASVLLLAGAVGINRPRLPALVLVLVVLGGLAVQAMKLALASPRPLAVLPPELLVVVGTVLKARSMPSGHAAMLASLAGSAWLAAPWAGRHLGLAAVVGLSLLALLGALARVVVVAHWPSDVLVGVGLGLIMAALCAGSAHCQRLVDALAWGLAGRVGSRMMASLMVALAAMLWVAERDYPLADSWYAGLAIVGLLAALGWWSRHPLPIVAKSWLPAPVRSVLARVGMRRS
jgi:undecaprenyl-diphosphatase